MFYGSTKVNTELDWLYQTKIHTTHIVYQIKYRSSVIFMEDHNPVRPDRCLLLGRQTSKWSLLDVVFHENNSTGNLTKIYKFFAHFIKSKS